MNPQRSTPWTVYVSSLRVSVTWSLHRLKSDTVVSVRHILGRLQFQLKETKIVSPIVSFLTYLGQVHTGNITQQRFGAECCSHNVKAHFLKHALPCWHKKRLKWSIFTQTPNQNVELVVICSAIITVTWTWCKSSDTKWSIIGQRRKIVGKFCMSNWQQSKKVEVGVNKIYMSPTVPFPVVQPWILPDPIVILKLLEKKGKDHISNQESVQRYIDEMYHGHIHVLTDASKTIINWVWY